MKKIAISIFVLIICQSLIFTTKYERRIELIKERLFLILDRLEFIQVHIISEGILQEVWDEIYQILKSKINLLIWNHQFHQIRPLSIDDIEHRPQSYEYAGTIRGIEISSFSIIHYEIFCDQ